MKENLKAKALENEKVQQFLANDYVQKAEQNKILIYHVFLGFLFVGPWFGMVVSSNCYAMNRPDYFWPVKEGTPDQEYFSVYNVSSKFRMIFLLGFITHMSQLAMNHVEIKNDEVKDNPRRHRAEDVEDAEKRGKKIQVGQIILFVLRVLFFLWIMNNRYSHVGKVCVGDYNGWEHLKKGSNYNSTMDYTYLPFAGFVMKMFIWVFMLKFLYNGIKAVIDDVHLGIASKDVDDDDGYNRMSGSNYGSSPSRGRGRDMERGGRSPNRSISPY